MENFCLNYKYTLGYNLKLFRIMTQDQKIFQATI